MLTMIFEFCVAAVMVSLVITLLYSDTQNDHAQRGKTIAYRLGCPPKTREAYIALSKITSKKEYTDLMRKQDELDREDFINSYPWDPGK